MRAVMLMFDSLNRNFLPPFGADHVHAPNFQRLAEHSVTFDTCYAGSLPCMPARRELHTGRYNFLHRSWGPLEPYDDSMPAILRDNGVHAHLSSDHHHYWESGGANYHCQYTTWDAIRGQEGDPWIGEVSRDTPQSGGAPGGRPSRYEQDIVNARHSPGEQGQPIARTYESGLDFLRRNRKAGNWFLQIEAFDPHEPLSAPQRYRDLYGLDDSRSGSVWPAYGQAPTDDALLRSFRLEYAAQVSQCDHYLGLMLDEFDRHNLWDDTMLIVNTDHGFMLGEHGFVGKMKMPFYDEVARIPLFIWDPRSRIAGERRRSLVQTIDIPATVLDFFELPLPAGMQGSPLGPVVAGDDPVRDDAIFGMFGGHVNYTDGRYVYMRGCRTAENQPLSEYTLMPANMTSHFPLPLFRPESMELTGPLEFSKGCPVLKIRMPDAQPGQTLESGGRFFSGSHTQNHLFDLERDPSQSEEIRDPALEDRIVNKLVAIMHESGATDEQFQRLGLSGPT